MITIKHIVTRANSAGRIFYMTQFDFKGKHVFVSGGTSGINLTIAESFAEQGAKLTVISRSQDKVKHAVAKIKNFNVQAIGFAVDVRDYHDIENALAEAHKQFGNIDVLINGAAGNFPAHATGMSSNGFKSVMDIDVLGSFNVARASYEYLTKPGASVINISAPQSLLAMKTQIHVCAAKAGVDMLTRVLALEWGGDGIRVNSIIPGPIANTEGMTRLASTPELVKKVIDTVPMKRMGSRTDIANAALLLSSPLAGFINGAILTVDGGWSLGGASEAMAALSGTIRDQKTN